MIIITTKIEIKGKTPEQIYNWILNFDDEKYKKWQPAHKVWRTIKRTPNEMGSIVYLDEQFNQFRLKLT